MSELHLGCFSDKIIFPIIEVSSDAASEPEDMGTKEKFWFYDPDRGRCL